MTKYIFITGGVVSSLGKGVCAGSLATILQGYGYKVRIRKLDPYLNVDPGTMSPMQHGEVFVTDDGAETDLDLGHYERFTDITSKRNDNVTAGQIYSKLLQKERKGDYLGGTVQVIPHVTNLIKEFVYNHGNSEDFIICEIGGTVGDIEGLPFFEAIRQIGNEVTEKNCLYIHVTLIPYIKAAKELKTKPTQHSVKELRTIGISPKILLCRSEKPVKESDKDKIALFCNIAKENVIEALDASSIYEVPLELEEAGLGRAVLNYFSLPEDQHSDLGKWKEYLACMKKAKEEIEVAIVGKYVGLEESYKSLIEALTHAGYAQKHKVKIRWIDARKLEKNGDVEASLQNVDAILIPGAFGFEGNIGKQMSITYARENNIPFFGICYGLQMVIIEFARNILSLKNPYSSELSENPAEDDHMVVGLMSEWQSHDKLEKRSKEGDLGGTMRLGSYPCHLKEGSRVAKIYDSLEIFERHRHRYEVNMNYKDAFEAKGLIFSGLSPDNKLPEIVELEGHPYFVAVQFHPELKSRPFKVHPLFDAFIAAGIKHRKERSQN